MDQKKIAIIVLVGIVVVFVIALAAGTGTRGGDDPGGLTALEGLKGKPLTTDKVTLSCTANSPTQISFNGSCTITLSPAGRFARPRRLVLAAAAPSPAIRVDYKPSTGPDLEKSNLDCIEISVDRKGAQIDLSCAGACAVTFQQSDCPES